MTVYFETIFEEIADPASDEPVPEITPDGIRRRHCACCGRPARVSFHDLKRHRRTLLCDACRPPERLPALPFTGPE